MNLQKFIFRNLYQRTIISYLLFPFSILFYFVSILHTLFYKFFNYPHFFKVKIIVIGNIVSGGTGKTPFTIFLARLLANKGYQIAVSHRDYKGGFENTPSLLSDRQRVFDFCRYACDEARLIAESLPGIPVVAGRDRVRAINLLSRTYQDLDFVILDDSFQNKKIKSDYRLLLFNSNGGYGNGFLLPAGILREPLRNSRRADCVIINGKSRLPAIEFYSKNVLYGQLLPVQFRTESGENIDISTLQNSRCILLSAIGNPPSFEKSITDLDISFDCHFSFPDHFDYQTDNWQDGITKTISEKDISFVITTEKDFTKLKDIKKEFTVVILTVEFYLEKGDEDFLIEQLTFQRENC